MQQVLERVLAQPDVRRARSGEFSQRAVLNGRLDLTRAEAISELVAARSRRAADLAMAGLDGGIQAQITALRERLLDQLTELEARVDFEEDLPPLDGDALLNELQAVRDGLRPGGRRPSQRRPASGAAGGVGRSSQCGQELPAQSAEPTRAGDRDRSARHHRDLLESEIVLQGVPITLLDTAGIRTTSDAVEQLGIARSEEALASADVVLLMVDGSIGWTDEDAALLERIPAAVPRLIVANKADRPPGPMPESVTVDVTISALPAMGKSS